MVHKVTLAGLALLIFSFGCFAQGDSAWQRIRSADARVSVEVPAGAKAFFDADGFTVSSGFGNSGHSLKDVWIINAIEGNTLVSLESYNASSSALDRIYEQDHQRRGGESATKGKIGGIEVKEIRMRSSDSLVVRKYFRVDDAIYILSAASRVDSSPKMDRFFGSLRILQEDQIDSEAKNAISFTLLPRLDMAIETKQVDGQGSQPDNKQETGVTKLAIAHKPFPSYTPAVRDNRVSGRIILRVSFGASGHVEKIVIVQSLDHGMLRQAVFSCLRIKFLPKLRNGSPEVSTNPIEYTFNIS